MWFHCLLVKSLLFFLTTAESEIEDLDIFSRIGPACDEVTCLPGKHCIYIDARCSFPDTAPCESAACVPDNINPRSPLKTCDNVTCNGDCELLYSPRRGFYPVCMQSSFRDQVKSCPKNEMRNACGSLCEPSCYNIEGEVNCEKYACWGPQCVCAPGFVRSIYKCVTANQCSKGLYSLNNFGCPPAEKMMDCSSGCDLKCGASDSLCFTKNSTCVSQECRCLPNYKRNYAGECVHSKLCHKYVKCSANEKWSDRAGCDGGDSNKKTSCYSGCACVDGFLRGSKGTCEQYAHK